MNKKYGLNELREMFLSFFETKGHLRLPSFSLIPQNDNSLLIINSGMAPMKPYFKGEQEPPRHRVCTCQKCIRTGDIENIGKTSRHGTYFEMLGNFSFGDYFKHEAIAWSWEFLTSPEWVGLDPNRLYPSIYVDDDEAFDIWNKEVGISPERIFRFGKEDNFWEHGAGPCGPCSEIYYDRGEKYGCGKPDCTVGCDCDRYIEVWNNVFSQFDNDGNGNYTELKQKNIDTGMGLERLAVVCQDVDSLFDVDTIMNITNKVSELTGAYYGKDHKTDVSLRVITDHIRSATFMICDGILPSNNGRGYVLRRLLRRAARHGRLLGIKEAFLYNIVDTVVHENECQYPELREKQTFITNIIKTEENNFSKTLDAGLIIFKEMLSETNDKVFSGDNAFKLYDTYGFPLDLTIDMCEENGFEVDVDAFNHCMEKQKNIARSDRASKGDLGWAGIEFGKDIKDTEFVGYESSSSDGCVLAVVSQDKLIDELQSGEEGIIVLDKSVLYAEMGGQVADKGIISNSDCTFIVTNVQKNKGGKFMHYGILEKGIMHVGDSVTCSYDTSRRLSVARAHSATHMLQSALRNVLGDHVHQAGSLVEDDVLRFDFTNPNALTPDELNSVEDIVNDFILSGTEIITEVMNTEDAKKTGATALFGEKYGETVRVVRMGDYSTEFCGGTHLKNSSMVGSFKIVSEASVASGVRRIVAVTGPKVSIYYSEKISKLNDTILSLQEEVKEANRNLAQVKSKELVKDASSFLNNTVEVNGFHVLTQKLDGVETNGLREIGDVLKDKDSNIVAVLASLGEEKVTFLCVCGTEAVKKGAKAGDIIKAITPVVGGKGGGKPDSAMGGGTDVSNLDKALEMVKELL